jgi:hypothetical protein
MTSTRDKIELAQLIADLLQEGIDAGPHVFFGSTRTKSDYCKNLIKPLLGKYNIDTLLESLPLNSAKSLKQRYSMLMSCFDATGELLDQGLSLTTVNRYATDLIKELRDIAEGNERKDKRRSKKKRNKFGPIDKRFVFGPGQVSFDGRDLNVGTGAVLDIAKALIENFGHVVPFQKLDENSLKKEASETIRTAIRRLRKTIKSASIPVVIENRKGEGYLILPSTK